MTPRRPQTIHAPEYNRFLGASGFGEVRPERGRFCRPTRRLGAGAARVRRLALQNFSAKLPNLRDGELTSCAQTWIDSAPVNVYALYKPLRVGSKCSSSYVRILISLPCRSCFGKQPARLSLTAVWHAASAATLD